MAPSTSRASSAVRTTSKLLRSALVALAFAGAPLVLPSGVQAQEVVQRLPSAEERALTEALQTLARNPRNSRALLTAGRSALALGDNDAALGFFSRARDVDPGSDDAMAGLAAVQVQRNEPVLAIALFDNVGPDALRDIAIVAEHGLAYDLVGDQARAQAIYRSALGVTRSDELLRRLSLSQAISGDREASEATLLPLLQRQDKAAWRVRAFALAILGASDEAVTVVEAMMPAGLAREMEPFLRIMPRLTRAQQAAAANLGRFPSTGAIGRDTPEIAAYVAGPQTAPPPRRQAGAGLVPQGAPLGQAAPATQARRAEPVRRSEPAATVAAGPDRDSDGEVLARQAATLRDRQTSASRNGAIGPVAAPSEPAPADSASSPQPTRFTLPPATRSAQAEESAPAADPAPAFDLSRLPSTPREEPAPEPEPDFASVFADIGRPVVDASASEGGVDVTAIVAAKPAPAEPPPPAHPARIWVQLGVGQDLDALAFDWRRLQRRHDELEGRDGYRASLGRTNRMITGPFASRADALAVVNALKEAGHDSLVWQSEEGEEVILLPER